ncbi:MAG: DedA family protein [Chromatiales bacterium]|nr:DedA family protein [Chromatiales bacterium]
MRLFSRLFDRVMTWARHPRAPWYLGGVSFAESSFFPIPPDVMLAPMVLARPDRAWSLALLTTVTSVLGAVFGYLVGMWAIDLVMPVIDYFEYREAFNQAQEWFERFGFFAILAAAFSPIPYKMFTISAGVLSMALLPFVAASFIGRGLRFFLVAALVAWIGPTIERHLKRYMDILGWLFVLLIASYLLYVTL